MATKNNYIWIPLWVDKWLFGSTRIELDPAERAVWIDLLALAAKDNGYIRANETVPYPLDQLAGLLRISVELLQNTINKCLDPKSNKLILTENNTLYVVNWETYKLSPRHKRRFMSANEDTMSETEDTIIKENKIKQNKIDNNKRPTLEEVKTYCKERNNSVDPQRWFDHYQAKGWLIGKSPMRDWRAAVRTWERGADGAKRCVFDKKTPCYEDCPDCNYAKKK